MSRDVTPNINLFDQGIEQARAKIFRASRHIDEVKYLIEVISCKSSIRIEEFIDEPTGNQIFRAFADDIPPHLPLAIGDAIHNLNCALDYIATAIMRSRGGNNNRVYFPTDETRHGLRATMKRPKKGQRNPRNREVVEACPKFALILLGKIKPYRGGALGVWELRKSDNIDKHNLIIPTVSIFNLIDAEICDENNNRLIIGSLAIGPKGEVGLAQFSAKARVENYGTAIFSTNFPEDSVSFAGKPIIDTLLRNAQNISKVCDICEGELRNYLEKT